jgi:Zn-dependent peptidase ImmA (M78 family)
MDVQQKVAALIRRYKTDDPFRLAACQNIIIMYSDLGGKYGNYLKYKRSKFIIIDAQRTPESMLPFVCAHELGHALCTPNDNTQWLKTYTMDINADRVERLANMFAVELLLNDGYLAEHPGTSIYTLANCRGVPHRFIKLKKSGSDI